MSVRATLWVLDEAPVSDMRHFAVLVALADNASDTGRGCWPAVRTIARRARCSERTVHRILRELETLGVIRRGDQVLVAGIPINRRPVVYDLNMPARGDNLTPLPLSGVSPGVSRGVTGGSPGVTRLADKPSLNPKRTFNRGFSTCADHLLPEPCRGCAADRLVADSA